MTEGLVFAHMEAIAKRIQALELMQGNSVKRFVLPDA